MGGDPYWCKGPVANRTAGENLLGSIPTPSAMPLKHKW